MASHRSVRVKRSLHLAYDALEGRVVLSAIIVPGTANPYLADVPANKTGPVDATDGTPPPSIAVMDDTWVSFSVTGGTTNESGVVPVKTPNGGPDVTAFYGKRGDVSSWDLPIDSLAGVFEGATPGTAPVKETGELNAGDISPPIGQVFFIGDGLTQSGTTSVLFHVPAGATQLYLANIDGYQWGNNGGQFNVKVTMSSPIWSGYVAETTLAKPEPNSVTEVSGSWIVPTVTGPSSGTTRSSIWVGIDGDDSSTVEQIGTGQRVVNGKPTYYAWWEMISTDQPAVPIDTMTIEPGDSITASVQYIASGDHAGQFNLSIVNNSRKNDRFGEPEGFAGDPKAMAQRSSAEWIVEAPTVVGAGIAPLANFGSVIFTDASAVINGVPGPINGAKWQFKAYEISSGAVGANVQDTTSALLDSGTIFAVTYKSGM